MKTNLPRLFALSSVVAASFFAATQEAQATLLSYWNFNNDSPTYSGGTLGSFSTTAASYGETYNSSTYKLSGNTSNSTVYNGSNIYIDFSNLTTIASATINGKTAPGYTSQNATSGNAGYGVFSDSTLNRTSTDSTTGGSLLILNTGGNAVNKYITFSLSSLGYDTLSLSYSIRLTSSVTASQVWTYSLNGGTTWLTLTTISVTADGTFKSASLDLSSLSGSALNNQSSFLLKMTYNSGNSQGSTALDNIQLTGTASAIPEPSTFALFGGIGALGFVGFSRRRR